jgi:hypothetical protein
MRSRIAVFLLLLVAMPSFEASAGCGRWVVRENTDYLQDPLFDVLLDQASDSGKGVSAPDPLKAELAGKPPENSSKTSAVAPTIPAKSQPMKVDGKWTVQLDQGNGFIDLRLVQNLGISPEEVMISGTLGSTKIFVTGTGSVGNETLRMTAKTVVADKINKIDRKYVMELFKANDTLSGGYEIFEGVQITKGNATAIRAT